jgi:hypothetical protein
MSADGWFEVDESFLHEAQFAAYERGRGDPVERPLRVYARDPAARRREGATAIARLPYEPLEPGPVGSVIEVFDYDERRDHLHQPADLDSAFALLNQGFAPSLADSRFHQQMVYAVAMGVWHTFREALGRDPGWGFASAGTSPRLKIRPHAFEDENAYYDRERGELQFGYYRARAVAGRNRPQGWVFTCLSHDVVAHEITHALLDGMRPCFRIPTNPDVAAFHEAFADLVAIFAKFAYPELVQAAIERAPQSPLADRALAWVATQFGQTTTGADAPLRTGIEIAGRDQEPLAYRPELPPHELGRVLVSAVFEAFATVFERRVGRFRAMVERYRPPGAPLDPEVARIMAEQASQLARQFLIICVRAIDYCPPVDISFGDYLRAMITADHDLVPSDPYGYRDALIDAFERRRIYATSAINMAEDALLWDPPGAELPAIPELTFAELRFRGDPGRAASADELRRQARAFGRFVTRPEHLREFRLLAPNDRGLEGDTVEAPRICSIRSLRRIAPNREVSFELVAEVVQRRVFARPDGGPGWILGGATVIIGPDGHIRYVVYKPLDNRDLIASQHAFALGAGRPLWALNGARLVPDPALLRKLHGVTRA